MRKIRLAQEALPETGLSLDAITDPNLLATYLLSIHTKKDQNEYEPYMRVSALAEGCVRERVLGYLHRKKIQVEQWRPQQQSTLDLGRAFHWWLQNDPDNSYFGPRRVGFWKCIVCGRKKFGGPPKSHCSQCKAGAQALFYHENHLKCTTPFRASGHVDMYLRLEQHSPIIRIVDFKSVPREEFVELTEVRGKDAIQVVGYMILSEHVNHIPASYQVDTQRGLVVYLSKQHVSKGLPIKIFHVVRNPAWDATVFNLLERFTKGVVYQELPPPLLECSSSQWIGTKAKYCPVSGVCKVEGV